MASRSRMHVLTMLVPVLWLFKSPGTTQRMPTIEDIINAKDLERLFRSIVGGERAVATDRSAVVRRIRELAPLALEDLGGLEDDGILSELEDYGRGSVLNKIRARRADRPL
jgi:hypothetical protein